MAVVVKQWQAPNQDIDTAGHLDPPLVTDTVHAKLIFTGLVAYTG